MGKTASMPVVFSQIHRLYLLPSMQTNSYPSMQSERSYFSMDLPPLLSPVQRICLNTARIITLLFCWARIRKSDHRVEAYGDVDELNSVLGGLVAALPSDQAELAEEIQRTQSNLLDVGAWLAITPGSPVTAELKEFTEEHGKTLETAIDRIDERVARPEGFSPAWRTHIHRMGPSGQSGVPQGRKTCG